MVFKYHTACNSCGSKDNRAVYQGGSSYCFGCGVYSPGTTSPYVLEKEEPTEVLRLPDDASKDYGPEAITWTSKYGLSTSELIKNNVLWSEQKKQLLFTFKDEQGQLLLWQARNFGSWAKTKYYTQGVSDAVLPLYSLGKEQEQSTQPLVLVEDCVSAIKIARQGSSMPVLGSDLSKAKLTRLAAFWGPSSPIVVWLDGNMYPKAQRMAARLNLLGCAATAVYTPLDPKEYSNKEIASICNIC